MSTLYPRIVSHQELSFETTQQSGTAPRLLSLERPTLDPLTGRQWTGNCYDITWWGHAHELPRRLGNGARAPCWQAMSPLPNTKVVMEELRTHELETQSLPSA